VQATTSCVCPITSGRIYDWPVADTRNLRGDGFTTIIGAELHAPKTSVGELWHILANGLPLDFEPLRDGEDGIALARRAADAGAFVSIAHPAWSQLSMTDGNDLSFAHSVEVYNHGCAVENNRGGGFYLMDQLLNEGHRFTSIATDDAHFRDHDHDAFGGWVMVKAGSNDPGRLLEALKSGLTIHRKALASWPWTSTASNSPSSAPRSTPSPSTAAPRVPCPPRAGT
jgi:hypothetical protein